MHCRALCPRPRNLFQFCTQTSFCHSFDQVRWVHTRDDRLTPTSHTDSDTGYSTTRRLESHGPWTVEKRNVVKTRLEDTKDIYINDLSATLEAHRQTNRALIIRKIDTDLDHVYDLDFKRPVSITPRVQFPTNEADNTTISGNFSSVDSAQRGSKQVLAGGSSGDKKYNVNTVNGEHHSIRASREPIGPWQHWPADSIQYKEILGIKPGRKVPEPFTLDYLPLSIKPCGSWQVKEPVRPDESQWPWITHVEGYDGSGVERLQKEIKAFESYTQLTAIEQSASKDVIIEVESILQQLFPSSTVSVVGSHRTGLATPTSDIDFSLLPSSTIAPSTHESRSRWLRNTEKDLRKVHRHLHKSVSFQGAELVFARIPLVRAVHRHTGLKIQISTRSPDRYDTEFTAAYLTEFPTLRPIFVLLRYTLEMRNLNTPFEGGLGSYSLLMMIVAALKQTNGQLARDDLANHLLHVLYFYASADLCRIGFCIDPPRTFNKAGSALFPVNERKSYLLSLQDPADTANDLGRNAYAIKHVQRLFGQARADIMRDIISWEQKTIAERKNIDGGILNRLVRANYLTFELERRAIENSITKGVNIRASLSTTEPKAPDLSRRVSLRGMLKHGWVEEVKAERKRRGREIRKETAGRRALLAEKRTEQMEASAVSKA